MGHQQGEGNSLNNLGNVALNQGDYGAAKGHFEQSLAIRREIGDRWGEGNSLSNLGRVVWNQGNYGTAKEYFEQSLAIRREIGDRLEEGNSLNDLGSAALALANLPLAETYYQQALTIHQELNQPRHLAEDWAGLAQLKLAKGDQKSAGRYGQQILDYLKENPRLNGIDNPMRTFRFTWEVLIALGQTSEADDVLTLAVQVMQDYLDKNSDHALREMYLRQPHHRILWAAWQKGNRLT
jgi:tetratricopeptide (TPR) repeat protein